MLSIPTSLLYLGYCVHPDFNLVISKFDKIHLFPSSNVFGYKSELVLRGFRNPLTACTVAFGRLFQSKPKFVEGDGMPHSTQGILATRGFSNPNHV
jgi:hypothetical protein